MVVWTSFPPPNEGVKVIEPNTVANIANKDSGKGTLYIAESRLSWVSDEGRGFSLEYPAISLHAISKDLNAFPHECVYVMIDSKFEDMAPDEAPQVVDDEEKDEDDDLDEITEVRFIPDDKTKLEAIFQAMSECQALHPDPQASVSNEEDEDDESGGEYYDEDVAPGGGDGKNRNGSGIPMDVGQFDDADEEN